MIAALAVAFLLGAPLIALVGWQLAMTTSFTTTSARARGLAPGSRPARDRRAFLLRLRRHGGGPVAGA